MGALFDSANSITEFAPPWGEPNYSHRGDNSGRDRSIIPASAPLSNEAPDYLDLPGVKTLWRETILDEKKRPARFVIHAEAVDPVPQGHFCAAPDLHPFAGKEKTVWDVPLGKIERKIVYHRTRWHCWRCDYTGIYEPLPHLAPGHRITERLFRFIIEQVPDTAFRKIARLTGPSEGTIRNAFSSVMEAYDRQPMRAPLRAGLDEKWLLKGSRGLICDIGNGKILDITENRTDAMEKVLKRMIDRHRTEVVTADMYQGYAGFARDYFTNALLVVDKFHVQKRASEALDEYRKHLAEKWIKERPEQRSRLRNAGGALLSRWHAMKPGTRAFLLRLFEMHPGLEEAYFVKEDWYSIYDMAMGPDQAEDMFHSWDENIPTQLKPWFDKVMYTSPNREGILNYFTEPYTNAFLESMNSKIGEAWWVGRSYSLDVLRAKMVLDVEKYPMPEEPIRKQKATKIPANACEDCGQLIGEGGAAKGVLELWVMNETFTGMRKKVSCAECEGDFAEMVAGATVLEAKDLPPVTPATLRNSLEILRANCSDAETLVRFEAKWAPVPAE